MNDVRMKGFKERMSFTYALDALSSLVGRTGPEVVGIDDACGRALFEDVHAPRDVPCFDRSAMDGYAVVDSDTYGASGYGPVALVIAGETLAGGRSMSMKKGEAVRIMTGAKMPRGANAVVMAEHAEEEDGRVLVQRPVSAGENVSFAGEDIKKGSLVLTSGRVLMPHDAGVLASLGQSFVKVYRKPAVGIIVTGNEFAVVGGACVDGKIFDANSHILLGLVRQSGGSVLHSTVVADDHELIRKEILTCDADIVVVTGGTACGKEDHVPLVVSEIGELLVHGVAMRPAGPMGVGRVGKKAVFLLPGNPLAVCVAFDFFVKKAIYLMMGVDSRPVMVRGVLTRKVASAAGRTDIFRVMYDEGKVEPIRAGGGAILSSMVRANGYLVVPENMEGYEKGECVDVRLFL
ncbi:MAG: gephyrin-like molybdotransferase Glp [archaeon]